MYEAGAGFLQAPAFFVAGIKMKTGRFTAVKRSVLRSFPTDFTGNTIYYLNSTDFCGIL